MQQQTLTFYVSTVMVDVLASAVAAPRALGAEATGCRGANSCTHTGSSCVAIAITTHRAACIGAREGWELTLRLHLFGGCQDPYKIEQEIRKQRHVSDAGDHGASRERATQGATPSTQAEEEEAPAQARWESFWPLQGSTRPFRQAEPPKTWCLRSLGLCQKVYIGQFAARYNFGRARAPSDAARVALLVLRLTTVSGEAWPPAPPQEVQESQRFSTFCQEATQPKTLPATKAPPVESGDVVRRPMWNVLLKKRPWLLALWTEVGS